MKISATFFLLVAFFALVQVSFAEPDYLSDEYFECLDECEDNCEDTAEDNAEDRADDWYSSCWYCMNRRCCPTCVKCHRRTCMDSHGIIPGRSKECKRKAKRKEKEFEEEEYDRCWKTCSKNCKNRHG